MPNINKNIYIFLIILFVFLVLPVQTRAQLSIQVAPAIIEERLDLGETFTGEITVTNQEAEVRTFYFIPQNYGNSFTDSQPILTDESTPYELAPWIILNHTSAVFRPGETKQIPFTIKVPKDASPGGHFGGIVVSFSPEKPKETGAGTGFRIGTLINIRVPGAITEDLQLREFSTNKLIYAKPEVRFLIHLENFGNVLLRPTGPLEITDWFGKKVATLAVNSSGSGVLPRLSRAYEVLWQKEGFAFGRYQANITLIYGEDAKKTINGVVFFWVLPLSIILTILGSLILISLLVFIYTKLYLRKKLTEIHRNLGLTNGAPNRRLYQKKTTPLSNAIIMFIGLLILSMLILIVLFFFFA